MDLKTARSILAWCFFSADHYLFNTISSLRFHTSYLNILFTEVVAITLIPLTPKLFTQLYL